ncbi:Glutathione S-transferase, omega [hydrothermal vent metagenome]|uniref:Glutathione S-transferase, omega n=1 Tax=hydrothermal vent metagenome TaxID=652676 RepID=A0A3B0XWQ7_9ZZZZ
MKGEFNRWESQFRHWITVDGEAGVSGEGGFKAEPGRYHLYISHACPWAHRTMIYRQLKGLEDIISVSVVHPLMPTQSWLFGEYPGATADEVNHKKALHEIYELVDPAYDGIVSVPLLWDKKRNTIVNNESSEIIRMLNTSFNQWSNDIDFYPVELRESIDSTNKLVYDNVNNGVYRTGFATSQEAYEAAYEALFATLDLLEQRLSTQKYLIGEQITEADWRLFTTLVRFDAVYFGHFKCNKKQLKDYDYLWAYTRGLYQIPGVADTVNMDHIKNHYYQSHTSINPTKIVPRGPSLDFKMD